MGGEVEGTHAFPAPAMESVATGPGGARAAGGGGGGPLVDLLPLLLLPRAWAPAELLIFISNLTDARPRGLPILFGGAFEGPPPGTEFAGPGAGLRGRLPGGLNVEGGREALPWPLTKRSDGFWKGGAWRLSGAGGTGPEGRSGGVRTPLGSSTSPSSGESSARLPCPAMLVARGRSGEAAVACGGTPVKGRRERGRQMRSARVEPPTPPFSLLAEGAESWADTYT